MLSPYVDVVTSSRWMFADDVDGSESLAFFLLIGLKKLRRQRQQHMTAAIVIIHWTNSLPHSLAHPRSFTAMGQNAVPTFFQWRNTFLTILLKQICIRWPLVIV